jgi:CO dehydrogenase maturation factor
MLASLVETEHMTVTIALAGKGGVGKTTIAGMIIKYLVQNNYSPVLAIDADPSSNLNMVLGWITNGRLVIFAVCSNR